MVYKTNPDHASQTSYPDMIAGFTKRETIAIVAMEELIKAGYMNRNAKEIAAHSVNIADALIARLNGEHLAEDKNND